MKKLLFTDQWASALQPASYVLVVLLLLSFFNPYLSAQAVQQYKFTNNEGANAKDIHIEFSSAPSFHPPVPNPNADVTTQIPSGTFPVGTGSGSTSINLGNGLTGTAIANGADVILTFSHTGSKAPSVRSWYWTSSGQADGGSRLGRIKYPRAGTFTFVSATESSPTAGDGMISITVDNTIHAYTLPAGLSPTQAAASLAAFVDDMPYAVADEAEENTLTVYTTAHTDNSESDILVNFMPDSGMHIEFEPVWLQDVTIPTLSEWGVIILVLLLLAVGMVYMYQQKPAFAMAGKEVHQSATAQNKMRLIDKKLFAKTYAWLLALGAFGLLLLWYFSGSIHTADPAGVVLSAAVIAFMIQFAWRRHHE